MKFLSRHKWTLAGVIAGAVGGYFYYSEIGCMSGTCAITSNPFNSIIYGSVLGGLIFSMFQKEKTT